MNLDSVDEILTLRDQRAAAVGLRDGVWDGTLGDFNVWISGQKHEVLGTISEKFLRAAISYNAEALVDTIDTRLRELGVSMPRPENSEPPTVETAMAELKMYQRSWVRALGGYIRNKRHLIDALASTTEEMKARADKYNPETVPKAEHERRVTELLGFNNIMEQRMREAQRELRRVLDGTPADRLAYAVEKAAAQIIADVKQEGTKS